MTALHLANADVLPFDFGANADALQTFVGELQAANRLDPEDLSLADLCQRIADFGLAGKELRDATAASLNVAGVSSPLAKQLNQQLLGVESNWLDSNGIPGRPWFQHLLYTSRYTYALLELPAADRSHRGRELESRA